jgi:hypothetical protein
MAASLIVLRRWEVRLTHAEVDDVHTLLAQFVGLGYDRHGGGGFDASDTFGKFCDRYCFTHWGHTRFPDLIFLAFCSFYCRIQFFPELSLDHVRH